MGPDNSQFWARSVTMQQSIFKTADDVSAEAHGKTFSHLCSIGFTVGHHWLVVLYSATSKQLVIIRSGLNVCISHVT